MDTQKASATGTIQMSDRKFPEIILQIYNETRAMAEYALSSGLQVQANIIPLISQVGVQIDSGEPILPETMQSLVSAHAILTQAISPAKPRTIMLLDKEKRDSGFLKFLGPVSLIRQLTMMTIICLAIFIGLVITKDVNGNQDTGNIMTSYGYPLLINLLFYLSAAGIGASFSALYKANTFITQGTFDPTYHATYWIRFLMGLISGLLLAVLISGKALTPAAGTNNLLEPAIVRPLLAILGGFSADVAYTILSRLVETFGSLFSGSTQDIINTKVSEEKNKLAQAATQQSSTISNELITLQQTLLRKGDSTSATSVNNVLKTLSPHSNIVIDVASATPISKPANEQTPEQGKPAQSDIAAAH